MNSDPFSIAREMYLKKNNKSSVIDTNNSDPFQEAKILYDQKVNQKQNIPQEKGLEIPRHAARTGSRVVETLAGLPGDIVDLLKTGLGYGAEKIAGKPLPAFREALEKGPSSVQGDEFLPENIPSSREIREPIGKLTKGFTEPQSEKEELSDEIISDIASFAIPVKGKIPFARSIGTALASNLAKEGVKKLGGKEGTQAATKLGTMFLAGLIGRGNVKNFAKNLYEKRDSLLPPGAEIESSRLVKSLEQTKRNLEKGVSTPNKNAVIKPIDEILNKSKSGMIKIEDLTAAQRDFNELMKDPALLKGAKKLFGPVKHDIAKSIETYGKSNPEFLKYHKEANEAFATIAESQKVSKKINQWIKSKPSLIASPALTLFEYQHPGAIIPTIAGAAAGYGVLKTGELLYRIGKSPVLQKHYLGVIKESLKDNATGTIRHLEKMNEELKKK